jgi:hypothetical protein
MCPILLRPSPVLSKNPARPGALPMIHRLTRSIAKPLWARARAFSLVAIWTLGLVVAPLAHAEEHLREARAFDAENLRARFEALIHPDAAPCAEPAPEDALAWEEALLGPADPVSADVEAVYGPLSAYELRAQASAEAKPHSHPETGAHSHSRSPFHHSHGPGSEESSQNPFSHGRGAQTHSAAALLSIALPAIDLAPVLLRTTVAPIVAPRVSLPAWHRSPRSQSPPPNSLA